MKTISRKFIFLLFVVCTAQKSFSQFIDRFVFATGGHFFEGQALQLSATMGDPFIIETFSNPSLQLDFTQGFQQFEVNNALPVKLILFTGRTENGINKLRWKVENEIDIENYEVEKSANGVSFLKIGSTRAKNNHLLQNEYDFSDPAPSNAPHTFYRLKILEKDNSISYSSIIHIQIDHKLFSIAPNPASYQLFIHHNSNIAQLSEINIYHISGMRMQIIPIQIKKGQNTFTIDIHSLKPGSYFISFNKQHTQCFIKN